MCVTSQPHLLPSSLVEPGWVLFNPSVHVFVFCFFLSTIPHSNPWRKELQRGIVFFFFFSECTHWNFALLNHILCLSYWLHQIIYLQYQVILTLGFFMFLFFNYILKKSRSCCNLLRSYSYYVLCSSPFYVYFFVVWLLFYRIMFSHSQLKFSLLWHVLSFSSNSFFSFLFASPKKKTDFRSHLFVEQAVSRARITDFKVLIITSMF